MRLYPLIALATALALFAGMPAVLGTDTARGQIPLPPTMHKAFVPASITTAQSSVLTITVTNPNAFILTTVSYTDQIPAGLIAGTFTVVPNASCFPAVTTLVGNLVTVSYTSVLANTSCSVTVAITSATPGIYVNTTSTVTSTIPGAVVPPGTAASATLVVTAPPVATATPIAATTPIPPTATPVIPAVMPVIPQVFQHPVGGIFNGTRNNTPTPVRPAAAAVAPAVANPAAMPVLRPPSTGDSGLADNGSSSVVYGLALIAALTAITLGAARMRTVRQK